MEKILRTLGLSLAILLTTGCGTALQSGAHPEVALSAWAAYWDMEGGMAEYGAMRGRLQGLSYFAASFDAQDRLVVPLAVSEARQAALKKDDKRLAYLTIVNDAVGPKGKALDKDTAVLRRVLANTAVMDRHIAEIISLGKEGRYDGIELDYERIWKDAPDLVPKFMDFTYRLSRAAIQAGLKLRIVLEPSTPFDAGFCRGPEYVVMLYNLYGLHSGPGPKADGAFIEKIVKRMGALPDKRAVALATGGCLWEAGSSKAQRFLSQKEAVALRDRHQAKERRDGDSAALIFRYRENEKEYVVWYADSETINAWITVAARQGSTAVSLWRLGGNTDIEQVKERGEKS